MDNKVGNQLLTPQKMTRLLAQSKEIVAQLGPYGVTLSADDRLRTLHPRKGAEAHMQRVLELASKYGLALKDIPLEGMDNDLALARQFEPFEHELRAGLRLVEDTRAQATSEAWEAFLAYYGVLSSMAERSPELAAQLQTVVDFMANGPRKKPAAAPPVDK